MLLVKQLNTQFLKTYYLPRTIHFILMGVKSKFVNVSHAGKIKISKYLWDLFFFFLIYIDPGVKIYNYVLAPRNHE